MGSLTLKEAHSFSEDLQQEEHLALLDHKDSLARHSKTTRVRKIRVRETSAVRKSARLQKKREANC